jgi:hypothetical protein
MTASSDRSDWTGAFETKSSTAFGAAFAEEVVLEAGVLRQPVTGREKVARTLEIASGVYESLAFTNEVSDGDRTYLEWEAVALGGMTMQGVTVLTRNADGLIVKAAIHHRPLDAALAFSAEMARRAKGVVDEDFFASA